MICELEDGFQTLPHPPVVFSSNYPGSGPSLWAPMRLPALLGLLILVLQEAGAASFPRKERKRREDQSKVEGDSHAVLHLVCCVLSLDSHGDITDPSSSEELTDYGDQLPEVKKTSLAPPTRIHPTPSTMAPRTPSSVPLTPGLLGSPTSHGLHTCLICVCLSSSVYCDDANLENIPPLPQTTTYLYARFNRISRVRAGDFQGLTKLKKIDLSSNDISSIDDDALHLLPALQELILPENKLAALPMLPRAIEFLDVRRNRLQSSGIQPETFRVLEKLRFLSLADNQLDSIPRPLPLSLRSLHLQNNVIETMQTDTFCDAGEHKHLRRRLEDIRLDGNPINLSLFSSAYFCLPRLPTGRYT
ncbi:opticin [Choloepus didactylus]|uniref:opticin n=1 Tax=Choloepus didactylus TaxID=27675 RepID=UPI00189D3175|nr:opticin [Choloepus didactylus]